MRMVQQLVHVFQKLANLLITVEYKQTLKGALIQNCGYFLMNIGQVLAAFPQSHPQSNDQNG
ncbi:hypothetical protein D3C74_458660 [compost metagenome]